MGTCPRPCSVVRDPSGTPFVASTATHPRGVSDGSQEKSTRKIKYLKVPTYDYPLKSEKTFAPFMTIPSPKSVNLKGLREVRRVVIYHNDNAKPPGSPQGHCSTLAMSPTRCVQHNAASIQPCCCGPAGHDGTRNDAGPLPLGGSRRQRPSIVTRPVM